MCGTGLVRGTGMGVQMAVRFNSIVTVIMVMLMSLSACSKPAYLKPYEVPDDATPSYKLGWEHGCKSGFSAYGNSWMKTFYTFTQDVNMLKDKMYKYAWHEGFHHCRHYINRYLVGQDFDRKEYILGSIKGFAPTGDFRDEYTMDQEGFSPWYDKLNTMGWGGNNQISWFSGETGWLGQGSYYENGNDFFMSDDANDKDFFGWNQYNQ